MLKNLVLFLAEPLGLFISSYFHFFLFSFLRMLLLLIAFVHFTVPSLFFKYFVFVLLPRVLRISGSVFYSQAFFTLHSFLLLSRLPWSQQICLEDCRTSHWGSKHRPGPSVCLGYTLLSNCVISRELYVNLSKYVDKLLGGKSLINFERIS